MKQCKEHYEAIEKGDGYMAHMTYVSEPRMPLFIKEMQERSEDNWRKLKAEEEYLEKLPKELLNFEVEHQIKKRCQTQGYQENERKILRKTLMSPLIFILTTLVVCLVETIVINQM